MTKNEEVIKVRLLDILNLYSTDLTNLLFDIEESIEKAEEEGELVRLKQRQQEVVEIKELVVFNQGKFDTVIKERSLHAVPNTS